LAAKIARQENPGVSREYLHGVEPTRKIVVYRGTTTNTWSADVVESIVKAVFRYPNATRRGIERPVLEAQGLDKG
jgi:hypothetical protein